MANELEAAAAQRSKSVEMPRPTVAPMVVCAGLSLLAAGAVLGLSFLIVGAAVLVTGLGIWVSALLPGRGHVDEPLPLPGAEGDALRPKPVMVRSEKVEQLRPGMAGYRLRLPEEVYSLSAGIKGGIVGGLLMPVPALAYAYFSGHGIWYPVNLLAGMVVPGVDPARLEEFSLTLLLMGLVIHGVMALVMGLIYGVLLPTLPDIPSSVAWGGLLMPLVWTGVSFSMMETVDPVLRARVSWPWFIITQFLFGVVTAMVVIRARQNLRPVSAGLLGGIIGGLVMPIPAIFWALATGHGLWFPVNLLAGLVLPGMRDLPPEELGRFHPSWLAAGAIVHAIMSAGFGALYGIYLPRLPAIPGAIAWGGLLFPLLWTGISYGLMGVANPILQQHVDWPWFIISQFVFGAAAAIVVDRSVKIPVPPAGHGA